MALQQLLELVSDVSFTTEFIVQEGHKLIIHMIEGGMR